MKTMIIAALLMLIGLHTSSAQWIVMDATADSMVQAGTRHVYNVQFDEAQRIFNEVTRRYPDQPAGFFVDAMIDWWRLTIGQRSAAIEASFLKKIERVISVCNKRLTESPKDIVALFFKGGALGYRGRYHATKQNMFTAAEDGRTALSILQDCQRMAPTNHDILLGTGLYNYWAATLPEQYPALKPVMVFFPKGDKVIGLAQLKSAGRLARYANVEAKVVLLDAYMYFEKNFLEALDIATELRNTYPGNPKFHIEYARCLTYLWRVEEAYKTWNEILDCNYNGKTGYKNRMIVREALFNLGSLLFHQNKDLPQAIAYLQRCVTESKITDKEKISWQYPWALVRLGQVHDMLGKRKEAIAYYKQAQAIDNSSSKSYESASKYIATPYKR